MKSFQESLAWQRAMALNEVVDEALTGSRNFGFKDQLFRASLSICNNLAEGFEMPTTAHQLKYLWIAKGSCNEVCSMLILAQRRGYFPDPEVARMLDMQEETARLIKSYIKNKSGRWGRVPGGMAILFLWAKLSYLFLLH